MTDNHFTTRTEADAVADVTRLSVEPKPLAGDAWAVPAGVQVVDLHDQLAAQQDRPERRKGTVVVHDHESLSRLVLDLGAQHGATRIYAHLVTDGTPTITAVLNDHEKAEDGQDVAGWGDHRVTLPVQRTLAWTEWRRHDREMLGQVEFAQHIEDHLQDIAAPDGADLLEMALTFEQTTNAEFRTAVRLDRDTRQLSYVETDDAKAGQSGQIRIPEWITLSIAPFEGSETRMVEARLRTSARDGKLKLGYRIDRPEDVERTALDSLVEQIATATRLTPYLAKPPSA